MLLLSVSVAGGQATTAGFLNLPRAEAPGTLLSHPLDNDSEATGRTTSLNYLNGWLIVGAEAPGSRPGSDLQMRVYDVADPNNPVRRFPSDFNLVYPDNEWHEGNAGWNAHGTAQHENFVLPEVMHVASFGGIPERGVFNIPNGIPIITEFPIGYNRSAQAAPWLASFPWYGVPDADFTIDFARIGAGGLVQFEELARFDHVGNFGGGDWHPMFFGDLLIYARSGAAGHDGIVVYRLHYDFDDPDNRSVTPQLVGTLAGGFRGYWPNLFSDGTGLYVIGSETNILMGADISRAADPAGDGSLSLLASLTIPGFTNASYPVYQDQFGFIHNRKIDMTRFLAGDADPIVLTLNEGAPNFADTTQMSLPLGNLWVTGGYPHGYGTPQYQAQGMSIWVHQQAADDTPPRVSFHIPQANRTGYPRHAPLSFLLHEHPRNGAPRNGIDFTVRPVLPDDSLGVAVEGFLIHDFSGNLTFTPDDGLAGETTYQVDFLSDPGNQIGFQDAAGNFIEPYSFRFSTGTGIDAAALPQITAVTADIYQPAPAQSVTVTVSATGTVPLEYRFNFDGSWSEWGSDAFASDSYADAGRPRVLVQVRDGNGNISTSSLRLLVVDPLPPGPRPTHSSALVSGNDGGSQRLWVVNPDADSVSVLDATSGDKVDEHPVCADPRGIARDGNGRYWITCHDADEIRVLEADGSTHASIALAYGAAPFSIVASPDGQALFVSLYGSGQVHRYSAADANAAPAVRAVFATPRALAVSADGTRVLVTRFLSPDLHGEVAELAGASPGLEWVRTLALESANTLDGGDRAAGVPNYLAAIAISPDGSRAAVASKQDNVLRGLAYGVADLTHETSVRAVVSFLDLDSNQEIRNSRRDFDNSDSPSALTFTPLGDTLLVALQGNNRVVGVDMLNLAPVITAEAPGSTETSPAVISLELETGLAPQGVLIDSVTHRLFSHDFMGRTVTVRDAAPLLLENRTTLPELATTATVASEMLAAEVLTGKRIFYNAADARMSADSYISCASCHIDGGHDGRVWDFTGRGEGLRRTTDLRGRAGLGHGNVHWTGNFDEIQDFEHDIRARFGGSGFLDATPQQFALLHPSPASGKTGLSSDLDALAAYISSLTNAHVPRSPARNPDGSLTAAGVGGRAIFQSEGCTTCHSGASHTNSGLGPIDTHLLADVGSRVHHASEAWFSGLRLGAPLTGIDTPSLDGLHATRVYLHHGQAAALEDVFGYAGGTLLLAAEGELLTTAMPPGVGIVNETPGQGGGGSERGMLGGTSVYLGNEAGAPSRPGVRFSNVDGGAGGSARIAIRYAKQYFANSAILSVNGVEQSFAVLRQGPDNGWQLSGWRWHVATAELDPGATNTIEILRPTGELSDFFLNAVVVADADDLAAAEPHRVVVSLSAGERTDLFAYIRQLDGRDDAGDPLPSPPPPAPQAPAIVEDPAGVSLAAGNTLRLSVVVSGTGPFAYQWHRGAELVGDDSPIFEVAAVSLADGGSYTVTVTNAVGEAISSAAVVQINPALAVLTATLPEAIVGEPYSQLLSAEGGVGARSWTVDAGVLPPGLTLSAAGEIAGVATAPGRAEIVVRVSDSSGSATRALVLDATPAGGFVADPDLILHYTFDEGSGTRVWDSAPNGNNHSTDVATAQWIADGRFGGAYGQADTSATMPPFYPADQADLNFDPQGDAFTISVWVRTTSNGSYSTLFGKDGNPPEWPVQYRLWVTDPATSVQPINGNQWGAALVTAPALNDGQWHLLTMVNRLDGAIWRTRLYYDGGGMFTEFASGAGGQLPNPLRIGDTSFGGNPWNGQMDDLRIYGRALTQAEVGLLYTPPPPTPTPTPTAFDTATPTVVDIATPTATATVTATPTGSATPTTTPSATPTAAGDCPLEPLPGCVGGSSDGFKLRDGEGVRRQLSLKATRLAAPLAAADFGDPLSASATYRLCVYDSIGGTPQLSMGLNLPGGGLCGSRSCWRAIGSSGFVFRDRDGAHAGVRKLVLKGGAAGRGKLQLTAKGEALPLAAPLAGAQYFGVDPTVVVQLSESLTGNCWQSTIEAAGVRRNDGQQFDGVRR
ncbi:MAG TPA: LamG-like jellyroll fold domain-containing protein [Terriglobales bacterium]|nr:LamG-like jellyroll fold domain-containing protein [Terriglobales bacterium]